MKLEFWYGNEKSIEMKEEVTRRDIGNRNKGERRMIERLVMTKRT